MPPVDNPDVGSKPLNSSAFMSLLEYVQIIVHRKWLIFFSTFITAAVVAGYSLTLPNIYTATTLIVPGEEDKGGIGAMLGQLGGLASLAGGAGIGGPTKLDLYVTMLSTSTIKDPIIDRFKLMDVYQAKLRTSAYNALNSNVAITPGKKDGVITISVHDKDPKLAADIANAYAEELGKLVLNMNTTGAKNNRFFLEERLKLAKVELVKAEDDLRNFQQRNKAVSVTDQAKASIEGVAALKGQLAMHEVQLGTLRTQQTDSSSEVKAAKATIANLKSHIAKLEGGGSSSSIPSIGNVPEIGQEYVRLLREFKIQETLVEMLTKQYEVVRINEAKDISAVQVLQKASVPERKSKPQRFKLVLLATVASCFLSVFYVLLCESLKRLSEEDLLRWKQIKASFGLKS